MGVDRDLRPLVNGLYDLQQLRIATGNRIVANFRNKLDIIADKDLDKKNKEDQKLMKKLRKDYDRITDGIVRINPKTFKPGDLIHSVPELMMVRQYVHICLCEDEVEKDMARVLHEKPLWIEYLDGVKGVGTKMGSVIMAYIDIVKATYPSSIHAYAGLDVGPDGQGRSRRKEHLEEIDYIDKDGNDAKKMGLTFNPKLKSKLIGVLGPSFLKCKGPYSDVYNNYKHRLQNDPRHKDKSKGHIHNMAVRYMVKIFLTDLYLFWRGMEGLEVSSPYSEAKLGMKPHRRN